METHTREHGHEIEVAGITGGKGCEGAVCCFANVKTDARERAASMRKLVIAVALCGVLMIVEVVGGRKANSLAILTDAAHLLSDVASFAISLFSLWAAGWEATPRLSYGFSRIEIIGALVSVQLIWLVTGILVYEAVLRLVQGTGEVQGVLMLVISGFGLLANAIMALFLGHDHGHDGHDHGHGTHDHGHGTHGHGGGDSSEPLLSDHSGGEQRKKKRNINIEGAYLHVLGDSIQSLGVMIGGAIIWYEPDWKIIDLICTLVFSIIVLATTIRLLRNTVEVLMESTPREIDAIMLERGLCEMDEVVAVHELHVWAVTLGKVSLACHIRVEAGVDADMLLEKVIDYIRTQHNISHVTIQIERQML